MTAAYAQEAHTWKHGATLMSANCQEQQERREQQGLLTATNQSETLQEEHLFVLCFDI